MKNILRTGEYLWVLHKITKSKLSDFETVTSRKFTFSDETVYVNLILG